MTALEHTWLVVGAGFSGATAARLLAEAGERVLVIDSRQHIAGNAYDSPNKAGHVIHHYGPHLFHTNSKEVYDFLSRFTSWYKYEHKVLTSVGGDLVPMPVCRRTIEMVCGVKLKDATEMTAFLAAESSQYQPEVPAINAEEAVLKRMGWRLYAALFRGYSEKHWGVPLKTMDPSVTNRIPLRFDDDERYFSDSYQCMPLGGYEGMFMEMLSHPNIEVKLGWSYATSSNHSDRIVRWLRDKDGKTCVNSAPRMVYTGPVDVFFGNALGRLRYRSLKFKHLHLPGIEQYQRVGTVNEASEYVPITRTTEFKHLMKQGFAFPGSGTSIVEETPCDYGDPYYPMMTKHDRESHSRYQEMAEDPAINKGAIFIGRLAQYKYFNMDQAVASAMQKVSKS